LTLTLDTNCVSAAAAPQTSDSSAEVAAILELVDRAKAGRVKLQLTAAYDRDVERWRDASGRARRADWLAGVPVVRPVGGVFRLDVSVLGGPDVLASDAEVALDERLRAVLAPTKSARAIQGHEEAPSLASKAFSDIDHLIAHVRSGADAFVTLDMATILCRRERLADDGIRVCTPSEALALL
jgi:hypothetical protein